MSALEETPLCDECGNPATVIRFIRASGYNAGSTWRLSRCDQHELPGPNRPQIHNKRLLDKIGRLILNECGNYPLMESVISFLSPSPIPRPAPRIPDSIPMKHCINCGFRNRAASSAPIAGALRSSRPPLESWSKPFFVGYSK